MRTDHGVDVPRLATHGCRTVGDKIGRRTRAGAAVFAVEHNLPAQRARAIRPRRPLADREIQDMKVLDIIGTGRQVVVEIRIDAVLPGGGAS